MRAHAKAVGDGLEILVLLVDAVAAAPPPRLVDERSVGGIHEADDAVVDADGHVGGEVGELVFIFSRYPSWYPEFFDQWGRVGSFLRLAESCTRWTGVRNVDPDESILFFAGIASRVDALYFQILVGGE